MIRLSGPLHCNDDDATATSGPARASDWTTELPSRGLFTHLLLRRVLSCRGIIPISHVTVVSLPQMIVRRRRVCVACPPRATP